MNEVIQNILNRRSVRVYKEDQLKPEDLEQILKAGLYAPSACNTQPWHFTVLQNEALKDRISSETKEELAKCDNDYFKSFAKNEKYDVFYNAPTVIVVSAEENELMPQVNCAAAAENMMLAAESLDIGSCWIGLVEYLFQSEKGPEFSKLLEIPEGYTPHYAITFGYKKINDPKPLPRRENTVNYIK